MPGSLFLWPDLPADRARTIVSSFSASMLTFLVFVLSSLIMVVQLASAQLTPRIMAITFSDIQGKIMTCMLLFSFLFGTGILGRIEDGHVPLVGDQAFSHQRLDLRHHFPEVHPASKDESATDIPDAAYRGGGTVHRREPLSQPVRHSSSEKAVASRRNCAGRSAGA